MSKNKFNVELFYTSSYNVQVSAENSKDALEKALENEGTEKWQKQIMHNLWCDQTASYVDEL